MVAEKNINLSQAFETRDFKAPELAKAVLLNHQEKELLGLALDSDQVISNRAMWVLNHCADLDANRIKPFQEKLISHLKNKHLHSGVVRSILRMFREQPIPKTLESFMLDKCFNYLKNPAEAIAVRVFAMTIVLNISKPYPELLNELSIILHHINANEESPAMRARVRHTLKEIQKTKPKPNKL
ncbi:MAG: hypothetical protein HY062_13160 [Bacteroidetes bacterium]|nr:hypothetical protein [Bacteroidota bacterium]